MTVDVISGIKDMFVRFISEHFTGTIYGIVAAVEEALIIGDAESVVSGAHGKPLDAVADFLAAAFGKEIIAGVSGDADDLCMDAGFIFHTPERDFVGSVVVSDNALGHYPFALISHQDKDVFSTEYYAACAAANCSCHVCIHLVFVYRQYDTTKCVKKQT